MKRFFKLLTAVMLVCLLVAPAQAEFRDMWAQVYSWDGTMNAAGKMELTEVTTGVTFKVLQADSDTAETLYEYGDDTYTSLTNPVTTTNYALGTVMKAAGVLSFRVDPGESGDEDVDLMVVNTSGGFCAFVEDFNRYQHSIILDQRPNVMHHGVIWFAPSDNSETDTGIDFLPDTAVHDVWVEVITVDATETIDVGSDTDPNGYRAAVSVATAGYITDTGVITGGTNIDYVPATTYGALLVTAITGSDAVATNGGNSWIGPNMVVAADATSELTYTGSAGSDTAAGYIHYFFTRMR